MEFKRYFKYDKNYLLKEAQFVKRDELLHAMVKKVIQYYSLQYNPLGLMDDLMLNLYQCKEYDLENLNELYDELCGIYRFHYSSNQLELLFDGSDHIEKYQEEWSEFFNKCIASFCLEKSFLKAIITAAILYPADRKALLACNRLRVFVADRFGVKVYKYKGIVPMKVA